MQVLINNPFFEMFSIIVRTFDNVWRCTKSFYLDFPKLYSSFRERIEYFLKKDPISFDVLIDWIQSDTYIFEYKVSNPNLLDELNSNRLLLGTDNSGV